MNGVNSSDRVPEKHREAQKKKQGEEKKQIAQTERANEKTREARIRVSERSTMKALDTLRRICSNALHG